MKTRFVGLGVLVLMLAGVAVGDTLHLKNGRTFEGRVVRETDQIVEFEIRGIGPQKFKRRDIDRIETGESIFDVYDRKKAAVGSGDADGLFELAKWCLDNGLRKESRRTFQAVIKAAPDHKDARRAMGYSRVDGRWLSRKDYRKYREKRKQELEKVLGTLTLGDPMRDSECEICFCPPKGWSKSDTMGGLGTCFVGPKLHGVTLCIGYEVAEPADVAIFKTSVLRELKSDHGEVEVVATEAMTDLGGRVAKEHVFRYGGSKERVERHDIFFERADDMVHVWFICAAEDTTALAGLYSKVRGSFKLSAQDAMGSGEMKYELPDEDWERGFGALGQLDGFEAPDFGAEYEVVGHETHPTFILIGSEPVEGEAKVFLDEFRRSMWEQDDPEFRLRRAKDKEWSRKVAGADAVVTPFTGTLGGSMGLDGFVASFLKGDRIYIVMAMNFFGSMGDKYLKRDLNKLLDSLKIG